MTVRGARLRRLPAVGSVYSKEMCSALDESEVLWQSAGPVILTGGHHTSSLTRLASLFSSLLCSGSSFAPGANQQICNRNTKPRLAERGVSVYRLAAAPRAGNGAGGGAGGGGGGAAAAKSADEPQKKKRKQAGDVALAEEEGGVSKKVAAQGGGGTAAGSSGGPAPGGDAACGGAAAAAGGDGGGDGD